MEDWNLLLTRTPINVSNKGSFIEATYLYYDKVSVTSFNIDRLKTIGQPIAQVNALHSHRAAATAKSEDAGGLEPVLFITEGAKVMVTCNLWQEVGLCNGASGSCPHFVQRREFHHLACQ